MINGLKCIFLMMFCIWGASACSFAPDSLWIKTNDDILLWVSSSDTAKSFLWEGEVVDGVPNGSGILSMVDKDGMKTNLKVNMFYGTPSVENIVTMDDGSQYVGAIVDDKMEGFGVFLRKDELYIGFFHESKPDGFLKLYKGGKLYYEGYWKAGVFNGEGTLYKEDGSVKKGSWESGTLIQTYCNAQTAEGFYDGYVLNGKPDGMGCMLYSDSSRYEGSWNNGQWSGNGMYYTRTDTLSGEFEDGKLNGIGIYKTQDFLYDGDWLDNKPDGIGYAVASDSSFYSGGWADGKRDGYGDMMFANGDSYFGDWSDNQFEGVGTYIYAQNGDSYYGEWKDGLQNGLGTYTAKDFEYTGNWEEGWINGEGRITYANNDFYEGNFVENERYGMGYYQFSNGNSYEGEFVDGEFNGLGIFRFADGSVYEGEFQDGKIKGDGTLYYIEGKDTIAITAYWDGSNQFPKQASVLFGNGDLYEGELVNGFPTGNGIWTTAEEREGGEAKVVNSLNRANEFYKRHKDAWNKVVKYTSIALTVVEIGAPVVGAVLIATGVGAPIGGALIVAGKAAGVANVALNAADAAIATASAGIDTYNAIQNGDDPSAALKTLGTEVGMNVAFAVAPKVLKKVPGRKANVVLSASAKSINNGIKNSAIVFNENKIFGKCISIIKDETGKLRKSFITSRFYRSYGRFRFAKNQYIKDAYEQFHKKYPNYFSNIGETPDAKKLGENMMGIGGKSMRRSVAREKRISRIADPNRNRAVCEAHHVVAGNSQAAQTAREILECCGIGINDARNGIWLPTSPKSIFRGWQHGRHVRQYDIYVLRILQEMKGKHGCSEKYCMEALNLIKRELLTGKNSVQLLNSGFKNTTINALF